MRPYTNSYRALETMFTCATRRQFMNRFPLLSSIALIACVFSTTSLRQPSMARLPTLPMKGRRSSTRPMTDLNMSGAM